MKRATVTVTHELGLHLRAAARLVQETGRARSAVRIGANDNMVDGKSLLGITSLLAAQGTELVVEAEGPDEDAVVARVVALVERGFTEPA